MEFKLPAIWNLNFIPNKIRSPPDVVHTFKNTGPSPCKWINIHSPKGFLSFFEDMGIPENDPEAMKKSVDESIINKVMQTAVDYDMHIKL